MTTRTGTFHEVTPTVEAITAYVGNGSHWDGVDAQVIDRLVSDAGADRFYSIKSQQYVRIYRGDQELFLVTAGSVWMPKEGYPMGPPDWTVGMGIEERIMLNHWRLILDSRANTEGERSAESESDFAESCSTCFLVITPSGACGCE